MRSAIWLCALVLSVSATAHGQQRDTTAKRDTIRPPKKSAADSAAAADSAFLEQALKGAKPNQPGQPPAADTTRPVGPQGATNPRLLPDFSAVGDFVGDLSPKGSTQEDQTRLGVREVELAVQAAVDPYFRGDVFLGLSDLEKISIEQAYLTTTSLPYGLEVRLGRYLMPVGKQNTTHRHDLHTIEYPYVIQRFFSPDGFKGTGVWLSKIFAPFGFYQELQLTAVDRFGEAPEGLVTAEPVNKDLNGLTFSGRLRNYWDLSQASNLELSATAVTGRRERAFGCTSIEGEVLPCPITVGDVSDVNAAVARQSVVGGDLTFRWRPLQQGLYKSFILQAEVMRQLNEKGITPPAPAATFTEGTRDYTGAYVFARVQLRQRLFLGGRYDYVQDPENFGRTLDAGSGYLEWFPSEFSKLVAGYERLQRTGFEGMNRILLQASFALGPHKPHPF
jgi:hypothetical protein